MFLLSQTSGLFQRTEGTESAPTLRTTKLLINHVTTYTTTIHYNPPILNPNSVLAQPNPYPVPQILTFFYVCVICGFSGELCHIETLCRFMRCYWVMSQKVIHRLIYNNNIDIFSLNAIWIQLSFPLSFFLLFRVQTSDVCKF